LVYICGVGYIVGRVNTAFLIKYNISVKYFHTTPVLRNSESDNDSNDSDSNYSVDSEYEYVTLEGRYDLTGNGSHSLMIRAQINEIFREEQNINIERKVYKIIDSIPNLDENNREWHICVTNAQIDLLTALKKDG
jgi:hypothetical protein